MEIAGGNPAQIENRQKGVEAPGAQRPFRREANALAPEAARSRACAIRRRAPVRRISVMERITPHSVERRQFYSWSSLTCSSYAVPPASSAHSIAF